MNERDNAPLTTGHCPKHSYTLHELEMSCPYCIAEQAVGAAKPQQGLFIRDPRCDCRIGTEVGGVFLMSHDITCKSLVPELKLDQLRSEQGTRRPYSSVIPDCGPALRKQFEQRPTIMGIPVRLDDTMPVDRVKLQQTDELRILPAKETLDDRLSNAQLKLRDGYNDDLSRAVAEARNLLMLVREQYAAAEEIRLKHVIGVVDGTITDIEGDQKWFYVKLAHSHIALGEALERGDA